MIQIKDLHKSFGKNQVLKGIDLDFTGPGITAILGPNSSGKTTLIKSMLGMVIPDKGSICFFGEDIRGRWHYRNKIDYLPQIARFPENLRVGELLNMIKDLRPQQANDSELIELFELQPFLDKRLGHLSGGTRQKINIVQAFMYDSPIVILDEPTSGLDPVALVKFKGLLQREKENGKTILVTTHIMSFVEEMAQDMVFLLEGKIHYRGSIQELKKQYQEQQLERAIARILQSGKEVPSYASNGQANKEHFPAIKS